MMQTVNDPQLNRLRRYESILVISGFGTIAFGLWSVIRAGIFYFLYPLDLRDYLTEEQIHEMVTTGAAEGVSTVTDHMDIIITSLILTVLVIDLLFRLYVGFSARSYGRGRRRRGFYIFWVWIMAAIMLWSIVTTIDDFLSPFIEVLKTGDPDSIEGSAERGDHAASVSLLVDITSFLVLVELGYSSVMVKRLRKKLGIKMPKKGHKVKKKEIMELNEEVNRQLSDGLRNVLGD